LAASAPQFQSGWRIRLKPPIELSNINLLALRLITAKRPLIMMRNKRTMRTKLLLVTTTSHGSRSGQSVPDYHVEQVALPARYPDRTGFPFNALKACDEWNYLWARADKSFVSRRCSKFAGHTPRVQCLYCLLILIRRRTGSGHSVGSVFVTGRRERFQTGGWIRSEDIRRLCTMGRRAKSAQAGFCRFGIMRRVLRTAGCHP
jgi:hypothetical protein